MYHIIYGRYADPNILGFLVLLFIMAILIQNIYKTLRAGKVNIFGVISSSFSRNNNPIIFWFALIFYVLALAGTFYLMSLAAENIQ